MLLIMKPRDSNVIHINVLRYKYNSVVGVHITLKTTFFIWCSGVFISIVVVVDVILFYSLRTR